MRVVHLSAYDLFGGAAQAAFRLHTALRDRKVDSQMLVRRRDSDRKDVTVPRGALMKYWLRLQRRSDRLALVGNRAAGSNFSVGWVPDGLGRHLAALKPDIVHLHWVTHGFFRLESLAKISAPVVWTMHDMWTFTGGCHYAGPCGRFAESCGRCPVLGARREHDWSRFGWTRRQRVFAGKRITYVSPSRWLAERARASSLLRAADVRVIPNGIDASLFAPRDRVTQRRKRGLPEEKLLILAGSAQLRDNPRKGFPDLLQSLELLNRSGVGRSVEIVLFGAAAPAADELSGFKVHRVGEIAGEEAMASLYAAADVFVAPSLEDNLPNTVIESMAAGTPVVAYAAGGIPEIIDHGVNGLTAPTGEPARLADALRTMVSDTALRAELGLRAREKVLRVFTRELAAEAYSELYGQVLRDA